MNCTHRKNMGSEAHCNNDVKTRGNILDVARFYDVEWKYALTNEHPDVPLHN